jgi:hypothetical protein
MGSPTEILEWQDCRIAGLQEGLQEGIAGSEEREEKGIAGNRQTR